MQAKYKKLQASHLLLLGNDNSFQLVPGYDPGHTMGTGEQEPHTFFTMLYWREVTVPSTLGSPLIEVDAADNPQTHVKDLTNCIIDIQATVNSLSPLALNRAIFPHCTKKGSKTPAKPLHSLNDLAHMVDERFVLVYPVGPLPLVAPSWEETLVNLD
ncbi:hypothetical protein DSO57_1031537 [Entomophthora muscae]|uniref:Uncharacterized protein n=1 Tax=Entomophthora muscae TaxID=34485 RepID=A0ACC2TMP5_9FUNG|nr:hypothetical protein DSO57_1031537 [Entomophthora muscae]